MQPLTGGTGKFLFVKEEKGLNFNSFVDDKKMTGNYKGYILGWARAVLVKGGEK